MTETAMTTMLAILAALTAIRFAATWVHRNREKWPNLEAVRCYMANEDPE